MHSGYSLVTATGEEEVTPSNVSSSNVFVKVSVTIDEESYAIPSAIPVTSPVFSPDSPPYSYLETLPDAVEGTEMHESAGDGMGVEVSQTMLPAGAEDVATRKPGYSFASARLVISNEVSTEW